MKRGFALSFLVLVLIMVMVPVVAFAAGNWGCGV